MIRRFSPPYLLPVGALLLAGGLAHHASGQAFDPPTGGWAYVLDGSAAAGGTTTALDGTWNHDNGSDTWDDLGLGAGAPGGVSSLTEEDATFLRIQDTGDPRGLGFPDPGNRKIYLTHDLGANGATDDFLDTGVTLSFRVRVPTGEPLDDRYPGGTSPGEPWPASGRGIQIQNEGKAGISLQQISGGTIAFALNTPAEAPDAGPTGALMMNRNTGTAPAGNIDANDTDGTPNVLPVSNPNQWQEFWIVVRAGGTGTHQAQVWANGNTLNSTTFDLTAGTGREGPFDNVLGIGSSGTGDWGSLDIDFLAIKPGILPPGLVPGDVNGDRLVDLVDLTAIRNNLFESGKTLADGDVNFDGVVDFLDYRVWSDNSSIGAVALFIPEPSACGLAICTLAVTAVRRTRRR